VAVFGGQNYPGTWDQAPTRQDPASPQDSNRGIYKLAKELYATYGYDVYPDNYGGRNALREIEYGYLDRGVSYVALLGWDRGAETVEGLTRDLRNFNFDALLTVYIDAVWAEWSGGEWHNKAVTLQPLGSHAHFNHFQRNGPHDPAIKLDLRGEPTQEVEGETIVNYFYSKPGIDHFSIAEDADVWQRIVRELRARIRR